VTLPQALFLGLLQGATELFPVSSLGHAVIVPTLLSWSYRQSDPTFLPFLVLLHLGTAGALLILYWRQWLAIVAGFFRAAARGRLDGPDERLAMLLIAGTIPAGAIGVALQRQIQALFAAPRIAAVFLVVNAAVLFGGELMRRRQERRRHLAGESRVEQEAAFAEAEAMSFRAALLIGFFQAFALVPGISRSGITLTGGLLAGLRHQEAARFSFLLATPIIGAAGLVEVPELFSSAAPLAVYGVAAVLAGLAAYASARFLVRYFRSGRLDPYAAYCALAGVAALLLIR
jgi:undecaprenyl-diphosphatase